MSTFSNPRRVVVVGGGITGLAAAYHLAQARRAGAPVEEFLIESSPRLGGVIRTERMDGFVIEGGPDSFLTEKPEAAALARELGLGGDLVGSNDAERRTYILHRGRLVPLPDGLMLMVPTRLWPVAASPLIPLASMVAVVREWFMRPPASDANHDESVASFVRRHFGNALLENIADPLLAGVYGGDSEQLSVRAVLPRFWEMERKYGSLARGVIELRKRRTVAAGGTQGESSAKTSPPLFTTLQNGLEQLTDGLARALDPRRIFCGSKVLALDPLDEAGRRRWEIRGEDGSSHEADAAILALPAYEAARLLEPAEPRAAAILRQIPYASAVTVSLAYHLSEAPNLPPGFGFLVPQREKRRLLACTFVHKKFPGRVPADKAMLRCFLGGWSDPEVAGLAEEEIVQIARRELEAILNLRAEPLFWRVARSANAMAQYVVGHEERVRKVRQEFDPRRGIFLAGNAYAGIGISDCIRSGRQAAQQALAE